MLQRRILQALMVVLCAGVSELTIMAAVSDEGLASLSERQEVYTPRYSDAFAMKHGLFIHWVGSTPDRRSGAKRPDGTPYEPGTINDFANEIDVEAVADDLQKLGFEYVLITDFHGFGTMLHPSPVSDIWRGKGYASDRDVMGEMIQALKKRGIGFILFTHPLCGRTYSDAEELGWDDPTDGYKRWNDFINDVYAELTDRYGSDIMGIGFDSEFGMSGNTNFIGKLDLPRLRETILSRAPELQLYALPGPNATCEFGHKEVWRADWHDPWKSRDENDYDVETWPSYRRMTSVVVPDHWVTIAAADKGMTHLNAEQMYRYSVIQAATATEGPGSAWAASPYADASWEKNVREVFAGVAAIMAPVRESLTRVYVSTSYPIPEGSQLASLPNGIAATRAIDDSVEYIHVLNPPDGKTLTLPVPADGKRFAAAKLLATGADVTLDQTDAGVTLTLGADDQWDRLNTVIALTVEPDSIGPRNMAQYKKVTASDNWSVSKLNTPIPFSLLRLVDGQRSVLEKEQEWLSPNMGWSSVSRETDGEQWVSVDLEKPVRIREVRLYPRNDEGNEGAGFPVDYDVQVSIDGNMWKTVASGRDEPQTAEVREKRFEPVQARYVRVVGTRLRRDAGDSLYAMQLVELEVYE